MKTIIAGFIALCCLLGESFRLHAQGYVVSNGVTYGGYNPGFGFQINVLHDPTGSFPLYSSNTVFWLKPTNPSLPNNSDTFILNERVDIQVNVFLVSSNDSISLQPIQNGSYPWLSPYSQSNLVFQQGVPFYLGLHSGATIAAPGSWSEPNQYNNPVFGWARLVNLDGIIVFLDGALEYGGDGIYAGTQNIIQPTPEPNAVVLLFLGGLLLWGGAWKKPVNENYN